MGASSTGGGAGAAPDGGPARADRALVVGVAGKCCAGKDLATAHLVARGWREINVDRVGHEALEERRAEVIARFGSGIVGADGRIDRTALGAIVFADRERLRELESILHPLMRRRVREECERFRERVGAAGRGARDGAAAGQGGATREGAAPTVEDGATLPRGLVINAALLFPMHLDEVCDAVLLVRAPFLVRLRRALARDSMTFVAMMRRAWAQRRLDAQARSSRADTITVENGGTPGDLYARLDALPRLA